MAMTTSAKRKRHTGAAAAPSHDRRGDGDGEDDFGNQTLPVAALPDGFQGVPDDGSVYLAMVRQEAVQYPSVFLASFNPYAIATTSYVKPASRAEELGIPSSAWRQVFLARFLAMREALSHTSAHPLPNPNPKVGRFPKAKTAEGASKAWYRFLFRVERPTLEEIRGEVGSGQQQDVFHAGPRDENEGGGGREEEEEDEDEDGLYNDAANSAERRPLPLEPSPVLLAHLNISQILSLLTAMPYWIAIRSSSSRSSASPSSTRPAIEPLLSRWCFSLLAKLDRRLTSDEISLLRTLARACIAAISLERSRTVGHSERSSLDGGSREESGAWLVVAIVAGVWGQSDLWMDAEEDLGRIAAATRAAAGTTSAPATA